MAGQKYFKRRNICLGRGGQKYTKYNEIDNNLGGKIAARGDY